MQKVFALGLAAFCLAGCPDPNNALSSPTTAKVATTTPASTDSGRRVNCEIKNPDGLNRCVEEPGPRAKSPPPPQTTAEQTARTDRPFVPSDCTTKGLAAYGLMAELGDRWTEWMAYCDTPEGIAASLPPEQAPSASAQAAEAGEAGSREGTWYCDDRYDGSGKYGVWEMTQFTDRYYNCKRVD